MYTRSIYIICICICTLIQALACALSNTKTLGCVQHAGYFDTNNPKKNEGQYLAKALNIQHIATHSHTARSIRALPYSARCCPSQRTTGMLTNSTILSLSERSTNRCTMPFSGPRITPANDFHLHCTASIVDA